jgi:photosystem II stability/assembly factor-like uncharacterized protein
MKRIFISFIFFGLFTAEPLFAQWIQTKGPLGGRATNIFDNGTTVFANISGSGIYKSSDNGASWSKIDGFDFLRDCGTLAGKGNELFVHNQSGDIYHSTNSGDSWNKITDTTITNKYVYYFLITGQNIYALTPNGLFYSTDDGTSWGRNTDTLTTDNLRFIKSDSTFLFLGNSTGELLRSSDNGASWKLLKNGSNELTTYSITFDGSKLIAANSSFTSSIYISTDFGDTWTQRDGSGGGNSAFEDLYFINGNLLGRFYDNTFYISSDEGNSWSEIQVDSTMNFFQDIEGLGPNVFIATYGNGIYRSTDGGHTWAISNNGIIGSRINALVTKNNDVLAATEGGVFKSTDDGDSWQRYNDGIDLSDIINVQIINNNYYAVVKDGIYKLDAVNNKWVKTYYVPNTSFTAISITDSAIYAGLEYSGILKSTDNGNTWDTVDNGLKTSSGNHPSINSLAVLGNFVYAGTNVNGVYRSTNGGANWSRFNNGFSSSITYGLAFKDSSIYLATNDGFYKSGINDSSWNQINNSYAYSFFFYDGGIFIGQYSNIIKSYDGGQTWESVSDGYNSRDIYSLAVNDSYMFAASADGGVWRRPLSEIITSVTNLASNKPVQFSLEQNYPNPFNPSTEIVYNISKPGVVTLSVFNTLGQRVAVLLNKFQQSGQYEINFIGKNLSSGVYLYRLKENGFVQTKKMILLK